MERIRLLVADDSETMRNTLTLLLAKSSDIEVVAYATDGQQAVDLARSLRPDVITMDIVMPRLSGLQAIERIMSEAPCPIVVVSSLTEVDASVRAMAMGALEVIAKPSGGENLGAWGAKLAQTLRLMSEIPVLTRSARAKRKHAFPCGSGGRVDGWGIVASTGGPPAVAAILGSLPADLPVPVFIAQHIGPGFSRGLVRWLNDVGPLKVVLAAEKMIAKPGHVYLPQDGCDLKLEADGHLRLTARAGGDCPSGDCLLHSLASALGQRAGGVVLTGMGEDGAQGLLAIRRAGGVVIAQDEASSVVFGMPSAARRVGAVDSLLPLHKIAAWILEMSTPIRIHYPSG